MNINIIWNTILVLLPVLSFTRFTAIDIAVNLVSIVALYLLARDMKPVESVPVVIGIWVMMFAQVLVIRSDWEVTMRIVMEDVALSLIPIVSGEVLLMISVIGSRKFVPLKRFERLGGMKILIIPPIIVFLALYYSIQ